MVLLHLGGNKNAQLFCCFFFFFVFLSIFLFHFTFVKLSDDAIITKMVKMELCGGEYTCEGDFRCVLWLVGLLLLCVCAMRNQANDEREGRIFFFIFFFILFNEMSNIANCPLLFFGFSLSFFFCFYFWQSFSNVWALTRTRHHY